MGLDFFVNLKCQLGTVILSVGVKYSVCDLLCDANNYTWPKSSDMHHV